MANPFMFGDPMQPAAQGMADNPFLAGNPAANNMAAVNPFMAGAAQPQQMNYYQQPQMEAAANPFASFAAAPTNSPFGQPSWQQGGQQQQHHPEPHQQQIQGQFGQYTQVMAQSSAQPQTSATHNIQTTATVSQANSSNPFGAMVMESAAPVPSPQPPAPVVTEKAQSNPFGAMVAAEASEPAPPPPPPPVTEERAKSPTPPPVPVAAKVEPDLPPPPPEVTQPSPPPSPPLVTETPTEAEKESEEVLPPPPPPEVTEIPKIEEPTPIETSMNLVTISEPEPPAKPQSPPATADSEEVKEEGFSGIFNSNNLDPSAGQMAAAVSMSDLNAEQDKEETEKEDKKVDSPSDSSPDLTPAKPGGLGASLFGDSDAPMAGGVAGGTGAALFADLPSPPKEEGGVPGGGTTGDAIFADMPSVPGGTGANIFGTSEESAANTQGAKIFEVGAPQEAKPALGSMTGWDAAFDSKFDSVQGMSNSSDAFGAFGGSAPKGVEMTGKAAFGVEDSGFGGDDFSAQTAPQATPLISRRNGAEENIFLAMGADPEEQNFEDGPLFDDDTSRPLEPFPRVDVESEGWEMFIRHPPKKKMTAQRFWKKIYVKLIMQGDTPCVQLFDAKESKDAFQEVPLQPAYSISEISHQVFDQYSKLFTLKILYVLYKERPGIRQGQVSKMQKLTGKLGFLAKAVEDADLKGVKEFASDMKKLGVPLEHAPQPSEILKLGSNNYEELKQFSVALEEKLFKMDALRDRSLTYKTEEIQLTAVDEVYVEQTKTGHVVKQLCRVRVFFLSFLSGMVSNMSILDVSPDLLIIFVKIGMPDVELGVNDIKRMGLEVVGRHDILPVPTEQWIRYEDIHFHSIVDKKEFDKNDHIIK